MVIQARKADSQGVEAGGLAIQGHRQLLSKFEASLGYVNSVSKTEEVGLEI